MTDKLEEKQQKLIEAWIDKRTTYVKGNKGKWDYVAKASETFIKYLLEISEYGIDIGRCQKMKVQVNFAYHEDLHFSIKPHPLSESLNYDQLSQKELHAWFRHEHEKIEEDDDWLKTGSNIPDILKKLFTVSRERTDILGFKVMIKSEVIIDGDIRFRLWVK